MGESTSQSQRAKLRQMLTTRFSEDELRGICFDLGIDYENLPGEQKAGKVIGLLEYLERRNRTRDLLSELRRCHPDVYWADRFSNERLSSYKPVVVTVATGLVLTICVIAALNQRILSPTPVPTNPHSPTPTSILPTDRRNPTFSTPEARLEYGATEILTQPFTASPGVRQVVPVEMTVTNPETMTYYLKILPGSVSPTIQITIPAGTSQIINLPPGDYKYELRTCISCYYYGGYYSGSFTVVTKQTFCIVESNLSPCPPGMP